MLNSWFGSKSSRHRRTPSDPSPAPDNAQSRPSDASSVSQSTIGPLQTPGNLTSASDVPLDEVHAHIIDPSIYAPTHSLIHSAEKETGTLRTSDAPTSLGATTYQSEHDSAQITQRASAPERPGGTLFTPQDAILVQVFGKSVHPATPPLSSTAPQPSASLMTRTSDSLPTPPSIPTSRARSGPVVTIYEPFSGVKLGETPITPAMPGESSTAPLPTADDRKLWSSLERILELQAEIAVMHADMESVGGRSGNNTHTSGIARDGPSAASRKRMRRGQTLPIGDEEPEEHEPEGGATSGAVSEISTEHSEGEEDDEDEDGIHGYGKKRRDEEFSRLAEQFAQRKAAIGGIMNKLDALSTALKTFHTLPPPLFDLAASPSRTDTLSSGPSNVSAAPSPPPLHKYSGRSSSPLSSISPSQTGLPVMPPILPLSPPVPPMSTLAPPVSSGDPSAQSGLAPVVAPVLPHVALPTIIPGAPHVESPADMHHAQSIFQRVP